MLFIQRRLYLRRKARHRSDAGRRPPGYRARPRSAEDLSRHTELASVVQEHGFGDPQIGSRRHLEVRLVPRKIRTTPPAASMRLASSVAMASAAGSASNACEAPPSGTLAASAPPTARFAATVSITLPARARLTVSATGTAATKASHSGSAANSATTASKSRGGSKRSRGVVHHHQLRVDLLHRIRNGLRARLTAGDHRLRCRPSPAPPPHIPPGRK